MHHFVTEILLADGGCDRLAGEVPRGEKLLYAGTGLESYITEYTLVYEEKYRGETELVALAGLSVPDRRAEATIAEPNPTKQVFQFLVHDLNVLRKDAFVPAASERTGNNWEMFSYFDLNHGQNLAQGHDLASSVIHVPYFLDSGNAGVPMMLAPEQWLQRHHESGSSWPSWPRASHNACTRTPSAESESSVSKTYWSESRR